MKHIDKYMFDKQDQWMTFQMQKHTREVNETFYEESRKIHFGNNKPTDIRHFCGKSERIREQAPDSCLSCEYSILREGFEFIKGTSGESS